MKPSLQVDSHGVQQMIRSLMRVSGRTYEPILREVTKKILESAVRYTPSVKLQKAIGVAQRRVERKFNTYAGGRAGQKDSFIGSQFFQSAKDTYPRISRTGGGWWWIDYSTDRKSRPDGNRNGKRTFYKMNDPRRRWGNNRWNLYMREEADRQADLAEAIKQAEIDVRKSRGLCKASWLEIAEDLKINLSVPAYVRKARPSNGRTYDNGSGVRGTVADAVYFDVINRMPTVTQKLDGAKILQKAISTRLKAFEKEMRFGVFNDVKVRAERYPGIFVTL